MNYYRKLIFVMLCAFTIASCVSSKNLEKGGDSAFGGGYRVLEVEPGRYSIFVKTNAAPFENFGAAHKSWQDHAKKACKGKNYVTEGVGHDSYKQPYKLLGIIPFIISEVSGYAICDK